MVSTYRTLGGDKTHRNPRKTSLRSHKLHLTASREKPHSALTSYISPHPEKNLTPLSQATTHRIPRKTSLRSHKLQITAPREKPHSALTDGVNLFSFHLYTSYQTPAHTSLSSLKTYVTQHHSKSPSALIQNAPKPLQTSHLDLATLGLPRRAPKFCTSPFQAICLIF
jgi:hypothetical protein